MAWTTDDIHRITCAGIIKTHDFFFVGDDLYFIGFRVSYRSLTQGDLALRKLEDKNLYQINFPPDYYDNFINPWLYSEEAYTSNIIVKNISNPVWYVEGNYLYFGYIKDEQLIIEKYKLSTGKKQYSKVIVEGTQIIPDLIKKMDDVYYLLFQDQGVLFYSESTNGISWSSPISIEVQLNSVCLDAESENVNNFALAYEKDQQIYYYDKIPFYEVEEIEAEVFETLKRKIIYSDVNKGFFTNTKGNLNIVENEDSVNTSIENILLTPIGSRLMVPTFAANLEGYLFEPISNITSAKIRGEVLRAITKWDPRIIIDNINVTPIYDENTYNIYFTYHVLDLEGEFSFNKILRPSETSPFEYNKKEEVLDKVWTLDRDFNEGIYEGTQTVKDTLKLQPGYTSGTWIATLDGRFDQCNWGNFVWNGGGEDVSFRFRFANTQANLSNMSWSSKIITDPSTPNPIIEDSHLRWMEVEITLEVLLLRKIFNTNYDLYASKNIESFYDIILLPSLLYSCGRNNYGQLGQGDTTYRSSPTQVGSSSDWSKISGRGYHNLAIQ